jgi:hypothetical protein
MSALGILFMTEYPLLYINTYDTIVEMLMFKRFEKHLEQKITEKPRTTIKPIIKAERTIKSDNTLEKSAPPVHTNIKYPKKTFFGIKEYSSVSEIAEKIDKEITNTKNTLVEYLRLLDNKRTVAENPKIFCDIVAKLTNKKQSKEKPRQLEVNVIERVLDTITLHELMALQSIVKNHKQQQQRLRDLKKAQEALKPFNQFGDIEGIKFLVLEKEGIPELILLKIL